jgi:hypothetical protein
MEQECPLDVTVERAVPGMQNMVNAIHGRVETIPNQVVQELKQDLRPELNMIISMLYENKQRMMRVEQAMVQSSQVVINGIQGCASVERRIVETTATINNTCYNSNSNSNTINASNASNVNHQSRVEVHTTTQTTNVSETLLLQRCVDYRLQPRFEKLLHILDMWTGENAFEDRPIVDGIEGANNKFGTAWRKSFTQAEKKHYSRVKTIIDGMQEYCRIQIDLGHHKSMEDASDELQAQYDVKKTVSGMAEWMKEQGLVATIARKKK